MMYTNVNIINILMNINVDGNSRKTLSNNSLLSSLWMFFTFLNYFIYKIIDRSKRVRFPSPCSFYTSCPFNTPASDFFILLILLPLFLSLFFFLPSPLFFFNPLLYRFHLDKHTPFLPKFIWLIAHFLSSSHL
ncbi:hypothetical protein BDF14DRAFT_1770112, partial [Spinellus fusiger]